MARTRTERLWMGGSGVLAALIVVVGYFFLISPQRAQTSDVQGQVSSAQLQGLTLQSRITLLTSQTRRMASYKKALRAAQAALPSSDDLNATPTFLRTLQAIAAATSTKVTSLTVGSPTSVDATAAVTTPTTGATSSASAAPSSTSSTAAAMPAAAPAASLYSVAITANVTGNAAELGTFLVNLQTRQPRAVLISGVTLADHATPSARHINESTLNLTMTAFLRPAAVAAVTTPVPGAPVAAAPSPTSTP